MEIIEVDGAYEDYLYDESRRSGCADKIAFPTMTEEVREALCIATEHQWPVTVQGGRTGITGGCVPEGGLILNLSRMDAIGPIEGDAMTVQPGARLGSIRDALKETEWFFPSDLTEESASIGGMVANNASGARSYHYGAVRNWIQALEIVLPCGEIMQLERGVHRADGLSFEVGGISGSLAEGTHLRRCDHVKSAAGYFIQPDMDLVDLFIGAEGTLGVVTRIVLRLLKRPAQVNGLAAFFSSEAEALSFVRFLRAPRAEVAPVAIELFDYHALNLLRRMKTSVDAFSPLPSLDDAFHTAVYFEFDEAVPSVYLDGVAEAMDCWLSEGAHEVERMKFFRHAVPEAVNLLIGERKKGVPALTKLGTDMSVPDERMEAVMQMYHEGLAATGLEYVIFGHIGNNHLHVNILPRSMEEYEQGRALYLQWAKQVVEWGGSISAEHGIGKIKRDLLEVMYGRDGMEAIRRLKTLFDPHHLLNRGNLFVSESD